MNLLWSQYSSTPLLHHLFTIFSLCISCRTDRFSEMIPALLLIIAAIAFRIATGFFGHADSIGWMNFAPMAAIALCAAAYFPWKYKFTVPMIALLISDVVLDGQ